MRIDPERFDEIAQAIHSDDSPVGIDAKKTHILIIHMLEELTDRVKELEREIRRLGQQP